MSTRPARPPIVSELGKDPEMLELVEEFVRALPKKAADLYEMLRQGDLDTLTRLAHQLKGSAGGYGFPMITEAARQLEQCAKDAGDPGILEQRIREIADLCHRATATAPRG